MALQSIGLSIQTSCVLRPELRELVILTVAAARGCNFEWNAHLARAQSMGVSSRYLVAVHDGQSTADMDSFSKSVIGLTSMLLSHEAVDVHKYNEISDVAGPKAIFDVITIVSYYDLLASLFRAFELPQPLPVAADSGSDGSEPGAHHCLDGR